MRKLFYFIVAFIILTGCQNDGYLGDLFGKWQLRTIEQDGIIERCDTVFFSFQSEIFKSTVLPTAYSYLDEYGKFKHQDHTIHVDLYKVGSVVDSVMFQIYGPATEQIVNDKKVFCTTEIFDVLILNKKEMVLKSRFNSRILHFRKY